MFTSPEVGKTYLQLAAVIFLLATLIATGGLWAVHHYTPIDGGDSWWATLGLWLLRIAGVLLVLLIAPVLAMFVVNTLFPLLGERVFLAGVRAVDPARAEALEAIEGLSLRVSVPQNLIRLMLFVGLSAISFAVSLVPVVGAFAGPVLQTYFTARALAWELLDPYFEKLHTRFDAQHVYVRQHRTSLVGFALPFSFVMAIPLVGPLAFGVAQAAMGTLVVEVLEQASTPPAQT